MSLADSPDRQFPPEDKALKLLFPTLEDPLTNSFDDYINQTLWDLTDEDKEDFFIGDVGDLFSSEALSSCTSSRSPIGLGASARQSESSPQPWRKGLWCLNRNDSLRDREVIDKRCNVDEAQLQLQLLSRNYPRSDLASLRSPPLTPSKQGTKDFALGPKAPTVRQSRYARRPPISREVTLSPSPMYARLPNSQTARYETWQQDFQNFHLRARGESVPPSPPPSGRPGQHESVARANAVNVAQNGTQMPVQMPIPMPTSSLMMPSYDMNQPMSSLERFDPGLYVPRTRSNYVGDGPSMISSPPDVNVSDMNLLSPQYAPQPQIQAIPTWPMDVLSSGHNAGDWVFGSSPQAMEGGDSQAWFSSPTGHSAPLTKPNFAPSHEDHYPQIAAPTPQRPVHHLVSSTSPNFQSGGLMIQYGQDSQPIKTQHRSAVSMHRPSPPPITTSYPPLPPLDSDRYFDPTFSPCSPFTTPRRIRTHQSPDRSSSTSPNSYKTNHAASRSFRQTSPTRSARRKSLGNLKASGVSKTPRLPRTPKTPNGTAAAAITGSHNNNNNSTAASGAEMNFVNLTAADSAKLLSDVAPSGSSKTRARRDQEARDKRRRLSEAAVRAVRRAGGDLKALDVVHGITT